MLADLEEKKKKNLDLNGLRTQDLAITGVSNCIYSYSLNYQANLQAK